MHAKSRTAISAWFATALFTLLYLSIASVTGIRASSSIPGDHYPGDRRQDRGLYQHQTHEQDQAQEPVDVVFSDTGLNPVTATVGLSATVRWINTTSVTHSTVHLAEPGETALWNSLGIPPHGGEFTHQFLQAGIYPYFDLYHAGDDSFVGSVVVTDTFVAGATASPEVQSTATDEPSPTTAASPTVTVEPTPTSESSPTSPPPTSSPTPEPTPNPVTLHGLLIEPDPSDPCPHDARLERCHTGEIFRVRADTSISGFIGRNVTVVGVVRECETGGGDFIQLDKIEVNPGGCGTPPAPPPPTPTREPKPNLALGAPLTYSEEQPGFPAANAVDGDPDTVWATGSEVSWIYLDLGRGMAQERTFNEIVLRWAQPYAPQYAMYVFENDVWNGIYQTITPSDGGEDQISLPRVYARFVLLYLFGSSSTEGGYALREWEIYGRETVNQARGGAVVVSSAQPDHPATHAIDGDYDTYWASEVGDANPWIQVHLPGSFVAEVRLYWSEGAYPPRYTTVFYDGQRAIPVTWLAFDTYQAVAPPSPIRTDAFLLYSRLLPHPALHIELRELELYEPGAFGAAEHYTPMDRGVKLQGGWNSLDQPIGQWRVPGDVLHRGRLDAQALGLGAGSWALDGASVAPAPLGIPAPGAAGPALQSPVGPLPHPGYAPD